MSLPGDLVVQIGFGLDPLSSVDLVFGARADVSDDVVEVSWSTSRRSSQFDTFQAGTLTIVLNNTNGNYDPTNSAGSHYGQFKRSTPIWIRADHSATTYTQFFGMMRTVDVSYEGSFRTVTTITAVDPLGYLGDYDLPSVDDLYAGDSVEDRLVRILDEVGWPLGSGFRSLGNGGSSAVLAATTWGTTALEACHRAAEAEAGMFYCQRSGQLVHDTRHAVAETRQSTSQATIDGTSNPVHLFGSLRMSGIGDNFRNIVRVTAANGSAQEVDNSSAGDTKLSLTRSINATKENEAQAVADFWADLYGTETPFPMETTSLIATPGETLNTALVVRNIRDRVTVTHTTPGSADNINADVFIDGISGFADSSQFRLTFHYSSADAYDDNLAAPPADWLIWDTDVWGTGKWGY